MTWDTSKRTAVEADDEAKTLSSLLDGNCLADGQEVWAVYGLTDQQNATVPPLTHIRLAHSSDGGATIDWRSSIEDPAAGKHFLLPRITFEGGSILDVTYYAGNGDGDANATYRRARSTDGGKTFGPSSRSRSSHLRARPHDADLVRRLHGPRHAGRRPLRDLRR